jgi:hypothetical protein
MEGGDLDWKFAGEFSFVSYQSNSFIQVAPQLNEKVAAPVYKTEINGRVNSLRWSRNTLYPQRLALTSPTSGGRSVGIVRLRAKATEFSFYQSNITFALREVQAWTWLIS